jgi:uncharacterized iron-regulated protein
MKKGALFLISIGFLSLSFSQDKPAYRIYNGSGKQVKYKKMILEIADADMICFGELHDDPIAHWLQLEVTKDLYEVKNDKLILGAEMFESDNQLILDEYLSGIISENRFEAEARLWSNYQTDYKPLVEFARKQDIPFIATNIPRRYANVVFSSGFDGLAAITDEARRYIAPLPVPYDPELPCYKSMLEMDEMGHGGVNENFPRSQAIKDATMAYFIMKNLPPGRIFLHFNGAYHSDHFEGIVWYLKKENPDLVIRTISTVLVADTENPGDDNTDNADFVIVVPESMTRTH